MTLTSKSRDTGKKVTFYEIISSDRTQFKDNTEIISVSNPGIFTDHISRHKDLT